MKTSEKIDQLAGALVKAQAIMEGAKKTSTNPFYHSKYADLSEVWDTCRKPLTDNGLCFVQSIGAEKETFTGKSPVKNKDGDVTGEREVIYIWLSVTSRLLHISEQWVEDTISVPVEADPQSIGKVTTYIRRYGQMALCGIAPEDDDGEAAMQRTPIRTASPMMRGQTKKQTETDKATPIDSAQGKPAGSQEAGQGFQPTRGDMLATIANNLKAKGKYNVDGIAEFLFTIFPNKDFTEQGYKPSTLTDEELTKAVAAITKED